MRTMIPLFAAASATAQTAEEDLRAKLASPFLKKAPWILELENAQANARKTGRLILGYFTTTGP